MRAHACSLVFVGKEGVCIHFRSRRVGEGGVFQVPVVKPVPHTAKRGARSDVGGCAGAPRLRPGVPEY